MVLEVAHLLDFLHLKSPEHMELLLLLLLLLHVVVVEGLLPSALVKTSLHYLPGLSLHAHRRGLCSCPARIALRHALRRRSAGRRRWMMLVVVVVVHGCLPSPVLPQHRPYNESAPSSNKSLHIFNEYLPLPLVSMRYFYLKASSCACQDAATAESLAIPNIPTGYTPPDIPVLYSILFCTENSKGRGIK